MSVYFDSYQLGNEVFCDVSDSTCELADSGSRIVCTEIEMIQCGQGGICDIAVVNNGLILCDCDDSWNCNLCGNDLPFWNIVNPGESMMFQFQQIDTMNGNDPNGSFAFGWGTGGFVDGYIKDCCTGDYLESGGNPVSLTDYATQTFVGVFPVTDYTGNTEWLNLQMIEFDTTQLETDLLTQFPNGKGCFVLEFCFNLGLDSEYCFCSEPYIFNPCPLEKTTILLEGVYPDRDCFRYYYGTEQVGNGSVFPFQNKYRVEGAFEQTSFEITKEFVGTKLKTTTSQIQENWILKTNRVPQRVAKLLSNIFNAESVFVDGLEFVVDGEIPKNNEIGNQWFIDVPFRKIDCSKTYSCK